MSAKLSVWLPSPQLRSWYNVNHAKSSLTVSCTVFTQWNRPTDCPPEGTVMENDCCIPCSAWRPVRYPIPVRISRTQRYSGPPAGRSNFGLSFITMWFLVYCETVVNRLNYTWISYFNMVTLSLSNQLFPRNFKIPAYPERRTGSGKALGLWRNKRVFRHFRPTIVSTRSLLDMDCIVTAEDSL